MMLGELQVLLALPDLKAPAAFRRVIEQENALGKPTGSSRQKSFCHLVQLYGLDVSQALFRVLLRFAGLDANAKVSLTNLPGITMNSVWTATGLTDCTTKTSATRGNISLRATPIATKFGRAGFASGPRMLKIVGTPRLFLTGAAKRIAG